MALQKPRKASGGAFSSLYFRLPLPFLLLVCVACFFSGMMYGGHSFELVPSLKPPRDTAAGEVLNLHKEGGVGRGGEASTRRQVAEVDSPELVAMPHGDTGEGFVSAIPYQVLSWHPRAILYPNFVPPDKCAEIVSIAKRQLSPSGLALRAGETSEGTKDIRTSSGTFLSSQGNPNGALAWVENKMAKVTMVPVTHGEAYNVLRYEVGQKYNSHYDTFNPKEYGPQSSQRIASFLLYLTDVEEGGETMFPFENFGNMKSGYDFKECIGLKVKPRMGDALLFWSVFPNGTLDETALHGSCPVIKGEKFVATKWIRSHPQR